jgi:hypothetical protein
MNWLSVLAHIGPYFSVLINKTATAIISVTVMLGFPCLTIHESCFKLMNAPQLYTEIESMIALIDVAKCNV